MSRLRRLFPQPRMTVALTLGWAALQSSVAPATLATGAALGMAIPQLTGRFWPGRPAPRHPLRMLRYVGLVFADIARANLDVARIVLTRPNGTLRPAFMTVPLAIRTPEAIAVLAGTITMTPGTLTADLSADGRALLVHGLDVPDPEAVVADIKQRYETRLLEILG